MLVTGFGLKMFFQHQTQVLLLQVVRTQMFQPRNGSRPGVSKLLLLITDEKSDINTDNTLPEAFAAKHRDGMEMT